MTTNGWTKKQLVLSAQVVKRLRRKTGTAELQRKWGSNAVFFMGLGWFGGRDEQTPFEKGRF